MQVDRGGAGWGGIGTVLLPRIGDQYGGFRADGAIVSSTPVGDGRVAFDVFQQAYTYPDVGPALPRTTAGVTPSTSTGTDVEP